MGLERNLQKRIKRHISGRVRDFFASGRLQTASRPGLITLNPPYGRRIGSGPPSRELFDAICAKLKQDYKGWKLALLVPGIDIADRLPLKLHRRQIYQGGLDAVLMIGTI